MMRHPKFSVYRDAAGQWRWRLVAANGRIVCQGEAHATRHAARRAADGVKRLAALAVVAQ